LNRQGAKDARKSQNLIYHRVLRGTQRRTKTSLTTKITKEHGGTPSLAGQGCGWRVTGRTELNLLRNPVQLFQGVLAIERWFGNT